MQENILSTLDLIGDPHLGKRFINNVPPHRRGEREQILFDEFRRRMTAPFNGKQIRVVMGDLFDRPNVDNDLLLATYQVFLEAAKQADEDGCGIVVLPGNHDIPNVTGAACSYRVLSLMLASISSRRLLFVLDEPTLVNTDLGVLGFVPWQPFESSEVQVGNWLTVVDSRFPRRPPITAVFGHWDLHSFGKDHNLVPTSVLRGRTSLVVTGHDHRRAEFVRDDIRVVCTGSLLPLAHGEDMDSTTYWTGTLEELEKLDPAKVRNMSIRVVLKEGEQLPEDIDAWQIQTLREGAETFEAGEVDFERFDMKKLIQEVFSRHQVSRELTFEVVEAYLRGGDT